MTTLGNLLLTLAALSAIASVVALAVGKSLGRRNGEAATNFGYLATFGVLGGTTASILVLMMAFFRSDWSFKYVVENHSTDVSSISWLFKISAIWAGREGSLLLWAFFLACFAAWIAYKRMEVTDEVSNMGLMVTNVIQALFLIALFIPTNNPFQVSPADWIGSKGELLVTYAMNPLLQHWAMILHPPTLFIGYAGLAIPFAFAVGAMILGDGSKTWVELIDRVTVFSWLFMGIGIGLGAIWAYVVLGWGGYWGWDPVENASLLPWLTGVGVIHSFTVYRRRGGFKTAAVVMSTLTFVLVVLGTFITRSGIIESVHTFQKDFISLGFFLFIMVAALVAGFAGLLIRSEQFKTEHVWESLTSKESSYYFNNAFMGFSAILVAALTLSPAFRGPSFDPASYDLLARPLGILYIGLMTVCPILSWHKTEGAEFWKRFRWPLAFGGVLAAGLLVLWRVAIWPHHQLTAARAKALKPIAGALLTIDNIEAVIGLVIAAFAIVLPIYLFIDGARRRSASKGEGFFTSLGSILFKARSQSGGYLTHFGMGIILVGLIGSAMYVETRDLTMPDKPGSSFTVAGYKFVYKDVNQQQLPNGDVETKVVLDLQKGGRSIGQIAPGQRQYATQGKTNLEAAVYTEVFKDIFVAFQGAQGNDLSFEVKINPMISWTWAGFVMTILGTVLAMWPKKRPEPVAAAPKPAAKKKKKA